MQFAKPVSSTLMNWFKSIWESLSQSLRGENASVVSMLNFTPRARQVFDSAQKEARALNHTCVGTEHILPGLLLESEGVAALVLQRRNVDIKQTRQAILKEIDPNFLDDENHGAKRR